MFDTKIAVVTGATSGIGGAIARELLTRGATVHLLGRNLSGLDDLLRDFGDRARPLTVDLADDASMEAAVAELGREPHIDLLVHGAGVVTLGSVAEAPIEELDLNLRINLRAPFFLTRALIGRLVESKGHVVFVNSGAGLNASAGWSHYAASKHALKALADALRAEVKPKGVRVLSVYPGRTATPMQARVRELEGQAYRAEEYIRAEDVSRMVVEALSLSPSADVIDMNIRTG